MISKRCTLNICIPFYLFILISLINYVYNHELNTFTLSNEKIVIVSDKGIHFYTDKIFEEKEKRIAFNSLNFLENKEDKINFVQFSQKDEDYIMISVINIIYFFDKDGNFINYIYLKDFIKDFNYSLIPYKKEDGFLHYIICYRKK